MVVGLFGGLVVRDDRGEGDSDSVVESGSFVALRATFLGVLDLSPEGAALHGFVFSVVGSGGISV